MAIKFNPLTGNFDFTGSGGGGGGSAFFAGEVATYADLPLDGTAALDSRWLVRSNSGTWPFSSYKQAGVYVRKAIVGASRDNDYQLTDTTFFDVMSDNKFLVFDNSDATKGLAFDVGTNVPTSSTVTLTVPAASGTIARTETFAAPPAIGGTTAAAGTFTTLTASTSLTLNGTGAAELINAAAAAGPLRIYNTFTSATNHERGFLKWSSNVFQIGTEKGSGGGTARALEFQTDGVTRMTIDASTGLVSATGGFSSGGGFTIASTAIIIFDGRSRIRSGANGNIQLGNSTNTDFDRLQFGGATSSFPALKRSSTAIHIRLADDSAFAPLSCGALTLNGNLDASTRDIVTDTTTGTKIGTGTTQKIGFFNATPVVQQAAVADATDAASTQARLNDLLARLRTLGLIAT
jgi:hypothetical protein